jgi:hypothetical protein
VAGKCILLATLSGGVTFPVLQPQTFNRLTNISKAYEFFRFTKVSFRLLGPGTTNTNNYVVSYLPEETTAATTFAKCLEQSYSSFCGALTTVPGNRAAIPRSVLLGTSPKWYKTDGASTENDNLIQGTFLCASTNSADVSPLYIELTYLCELTGAEFSTLQP